MRPENGVERQFAPTGPLVGLYEIKRLQEAHPRTCNWRCAARGEIKTLVGDGFYEALCAAEEKLEALGKRQKVLLLRAEALKQLRSMVKERQSRQAQRTRETDHGGPQAVAHTRHERQIRGHIHGDVTNPSGPSVRALRQPVRVRDAQLRHARAVVLLTRLALARILSHQGPFPVIWMIGL